MIMDDDVQKVSKNLAYRILLDEVKKMPGVHFGADFSQLNGYYSAKQLRQIANIMDEVKWYKE